MPERREHLTGNDADTASSLSSGADASAVAGATTAGGGLGAKLADIYEGYWTVLRGVLPVLNSTFSTLRVEPPGEDSIEFKLFGPAVDGPIEGHQCKRSHGTTWTLGALRSVGFLTGLRGMTDRGWRAVFVSEQMSVLGSLTEKAKRVAGDEFLRDLNKKKERPAFDELLLEWGLDEDALHERLRLMSFNVVGHEALKRFTLELLPYVMEGDAGVAVSVLWQSLKDAAPVELDSVALWDLLKAAGHGPRGGDPIDLAGRLSGLADTYIRHAELERPHSLAEIPRRQAAEIIEVVTGADRPSAIMLTGTPGSGKSNVLAQVVSGLRDGGVVVGVLRLDDAAPVSTAEALGRQEGIGFGGSPVAVVSRAKADRVGVLVVDQVDTMSRLSGRGDKVRWAVADMLENLRASGDLTLIMACRTEDLTFDADLRRLVGMDGSGEAEQPRQFELSELTVAEVNSALHRIGLDAFSAAPKLVELLRSPLNLGLFIKIFEDSSESDRDSLMATRSRMNLLDRYHQWKADRCREKLGNNGFAEITLDIAARMHEEGVLSLPLNRLTPVRDSVDTLIHHGVLVRDQGRIRFFHETYYEYLVALTVLNAGRNAADVLSEGTQLLARRGLVRAILTLERDDPPRYREDLARVLARSNRSHIRGAVLSLLGTQNEVDVEEIELLLSIAADETDPMRNQVIRTLTTKPFAEAMADQGMLDIVTETYCGTNRPGDDRVRAALQSLSQQELLYLVVAAARFSPDRAAQAALPIVQQTDQVDEWIGALIRLTHLAGFEGGTGTGNDLLQLFRGVISAICARESDGDRSIGQPADSEAALDQLLPNSGAVHAVDNFIDRFPAVAADAVTVWLDAARRIGDHRGLQQSVFDYGPLASYRRNGPNLRKCAEQTPLHYVQQLSDFVLDDYRRIGTGPGWTPTESIIDPAEGLRQDVRLFATADSLESQTDDAIRTAVAATASSNPDLLAPILDRFADSDTFAAHRLLAVAYSNATGTLIDDAARWIADPRVRGLPGGDTPGWAWGSVVGRVAAAGSDEQRVRAFALVAAVYGIQDDHSDATAVDTETWLTDEEHVVLSLLRRETGDQMPEVLCNRLDALDAVLGEAVNEPVPLFNVNFFERTEVSIPTDLDDVDWLAAVADWPDAATDEKQSDAWRRGLRAATEQDPARFARLLIDFPASAPATATMAVLTGITAALETRPQTDELRQGANLVRIYDAIRNTFGRPHDPDLDMAIARCIHRLADQPDLPEDVVLVPTQICDLGRNPTDGEVWHDHLVGQAYSQPRGVALNTVAALLAPSATRVERLAIVRPLLEQVTTDPSEAVRILVPQALAITWSEAPELVVALAGSWLAAATSAVFEAPRLSELMWLMREQYPASTAAFLRKMAASPAAHARANAARIATMLAVDNVELPGFDRDLLEEFLSETDVRAAVADFLTQLVSSLPPYDADEPDTFPGQGLLLRLMNDESKEVRDNTTAVVQYMEGPLSAYTDLLEKIRGTKMFNESPALVLDGLSRRLGELPDSVVALCEDWLEHSSADSGDISTHAAAEAYEVTNIVLATYNAASLETVIDRCLDIIDRLVENGAGGANLKADEIAAPF
ncbi:ATP-binding protein [Nocardia sp. NBC_00565]|uniref:ATP-binding protein n=1 Tax=Nocardia sp. NBC_00565 TaxID=2975993 RepID=UPI002E8055E8|nr:ATP-binding protein [Nocardia sp. NBC_00565]WUC07517.1 ATP-binding protein [Nocardia sp. NBC_00565]